MIYGSRKFIGTKTIFIRSQNTYKCIILAAGIYLLSAKIAYFQQVLAEDNIILSAKIVYFKYILAGNNFINKAGYWAKKHRPFSS